MVSIAGGAVFPRRLRAGDKVRFVSPASTPDREAVQGAADVLRGWGLEVGFGPHAFGKLHYLAGTDDERLADFDAALRDHEVRAIFATRGGKGSYRIADRLDFAAARQDPKWVIGFSDITILQMALWNRGVGGGIHGAVQGDERDWQRARGSAPLKDLLFMDEEDVVLASLADEPTAALTSAGRAMGPLAGGNLDMVATAAGWALPKLDGCILLLEAVGMYLGQVDRQLTMLRKGGHLDGLAGVALGQFTDFRPSGRLTILDLLRDHLAPLAIPILGGLPLGHGAGARCVPMGHPTVLDTSSGTLQVQRRR